MISDAQIEEIFQKHQGCWDGDKWCIEDADLHPFARSLVDAAAQAPAPGDVEMSPEFTDTARAALLWVLWHHQGGSSPVGQPIRFALGMSADEHLNEHQIGEAKRWAGITGWTTERVQKYHPGTVAPADPSPAVAPGEKR